MSFQVSSNEIIYYSFFWFFLVNQKSSVIDNMYEKKYLTVNKTDLHIRHLKNLDGHQRLSYILPILIEVFFLQFLLF